jgi:hypothetical protein
METADYADERGHQKIADGRCITRWMSSSGSWYFLHPVLSAQFA